MLNYDKDILERTGIFVFDNALSSELCERTINHFYENPKKQHQGKVGGGYDRGIKNTTDFYIDEPTVRDPYYQVLKIATDQVKSHYGYLKQFAINYCGLQFQKNEKGKGFFRFHSDNDEGDMEFCRLLAPIFYLNNVDSGGETAFKYQNIEVKPRQGRLVIFPCTWTYYHCGKKPVSNNKYIITTFGMIRRS